MIDYNKQMEELTKRADDIKKELESKKIDEMSIFELKRLQEELDRINDRIQKFVSDINKNTDDIKDIRKPQTPNSVINKDLDDLSFEMNQYQNIIDNYDHSKKQSSDMIAIENRIKKIINKYNNDIYGLNELITKNSKLKDFISPARLSVLESTIAYNKEQDMKKDAPKRIISNDDYMTLTIALQEYDKVRSNYHFNNWEVNELNRAERDVNKIVEKYAENVDALNEISDRVGDNRGFSENIKKKIDNYIEDINNKKLSENDKSEIIEKAQALESENSRLNQETKELITIKNTMFYSKFKERDNLSKKRNQNEEALSNARNVLKTLRANKDVLGQEAFELMEKSQLAVIGQLEDRQKEIDNKIEQLGKDIDALSKGGKLQELDEIRQQASSLTEEELNNKINNYNEQKAKEEEIAKVINEFITEDKEKFNEIVNENAGLTPEEIEEAIKEYKENKKEEEKDPVVKEEKQIELIDISRKKPKTNNQPKPDAFKDPSLAGQTAKPKKPVVIEGSLKDLVNKGILPKNLTSEQLINICGELGINASGMNFVPNEEQLFRLKNDKEIKLALVNQNIVSKHAETIAGYDDVLEKYEKTDTKGLHKNFEDRVKVEAARAEKGGDLYAEQIEGIKADSVMEHLDMNEINQNVGADSFSYPGVNPSMMSFGLPGVNTTAFDIERAKEARLESLDRRSTKANDQLREAYQELEKQKKEEKKDQSKVHQLFSDYRIKKAMRRIERLSSKQGKLSEKQFDMMNIDATRCIEKKQQEIMQYTKDQELTQAKIDEANKLKEQIKNAKEERKQIIAERRKIQGNSLVDIAERAALGKNIKDLDKKTRILGNKLGECNREAQLNMTVEESLQISQGAMKKAA